MSLDAVLGRRIATAVACWIAACGPVMAYVEDPTLAALAFHSDRIVVATVEQVKETSPGGVLTEDGRIVPRGSGVGGRLVSAKYHAEATVEETWKGEPVKRLRFRAHATWLCDASRATEGERVLLFLGISEEDGHVIAWHGRGRLPMEGRGSGARVSGGAWLAAGNRVDVECEGFMDATAPLEGVRRHVEAVLGRGPTDGEILSCSCGRVPTDAFECRVRGRRGRARKLRFIAPFSLNDCEAEPCDLVRDGELRSGVLRLPSGCVYVTVNERELECWEEEGAATTEWVDPTEELAEDLEWNWEIAAYRMDTLNHLADQGSSARWALPFLRSIRRTLEPSMQQAVRRTIRAIEGRSVTCHRSDLY